MLADEPRGQEEVTTTASNLPAELVEQARLAGTEADPAHDFGHVLRVCAVSYTHLTLPTICSV